MMGCGHSGSAQKPQTLQATTAAVEKAESYKRDLVERGDLVGAHYTFRVEQSGEVFTTTKEVVASDAKIAKTNWFRKSKPEFGPEVVIAGDTSTLPELSKNVLGMKLGEKKSVSLPPSRGFGQPEPDKILTLPTKKKIPAEIVLPVKEFVNRFEKLPEKGAKVRFVPYFQSEIKAVTSTHVTLLAQIKEDKTFDHGFGITTVSPEDQQIVITLKPVIGASFKHNGKNGRIIESGADTFKVDFNHPGAGQNLQLDIEIVSIEKAGTFADNTLEWIEDHDQGYAKAAEMNKPMVMVLYAGWCGWSKKFLDNTVNDPRIQAYWDKYIWVKVNSDEQKEYKEFYQQNGYPLTVIMDANGKIIDRVDGFRDAGAFRNSLEKSMILLSKKG
jgi:FKBP-type peptidyl-prolyl cis-trans isomerase 2